MAKFFGKRINSVLAILLIIGVFLTGVLAVFLNYENLKYEFSRLFPGIPFIKPSPPSGSGPLTPGREIKDIKKFVSEEEFKAYLEEAKSEAEIFTIGSDFFRERE
jgi:hypothetical protein